VHKLILTGGPCAGKTTILAAIDLYFSSRGYTVLFLAEAATKWFEAKAGPRSSDPEELFQFQNLLVAYQLASERLLEHRIAQWTNKDKVILILDRSAFDGAAYVSEEIWKRVLETNGIKSVGKDLGYDVVLHLVTAADGAEAFYTTANNTTRKETAAEARAVDHRTREAYHGMNQRIVPNRPGETFDHKINESLRILAETVGAPLPLQRQRKFLVRLVDDIPSSAVRHQVTQFYVVDIEGRIVRARMVKGPGGHKAFYSAIIGARQSNGARIKTQRIISDEEFRTLALSQDTRFQVLSKERIFFTHGHRPVRIDRFQGSSLPESHILQEPDAALLEIDVLEEELTADIQLPPNVRLISEVTDDPNFTNRELSKNRVWSFDGTPI